MKRAGLGVGAGFLIRVMHALERMACDEFNVDFLIVVFIEESSMTCARDSAGLHRRAHATVKNVFMLSRDLGSEDRGCGLASRYL